VSDREADRAPAGDGVVDISNVTGVGDVILVCEHASNFIPDALEGLGLDPEIRESHIAWDPGALPVASVMSAALDAPLISHRVSRLVFDCNRDPASADAILERSEVHAIPGNQGLSDNERRTRSARYYTPFRKAISNAIDGRMVDSRQPVLVTIHSFVPVYDGARRDFDLGILHDADPRLADAVLDRLHEDGDLDVRRNEPYGPADGVTHTLVEHAVSRGLLNVMVEIRSDLIAHPTDQRAMAERLANAISDALETLRNDSVEAGAATGADTATAMSNDQVETV